MVYHFIEFSDKKFFDFLSRIKICSNYHLSHLVRGRLTFRQHLHFHRNLSIGCCRFVHCWLRISHLQHFHCLEIQSYQIFGRKPNLQQRLVRQQLLHRYHLTKKFEIIMTLSFSNEEAVNPPAQNTFNVLNKVLDKKL